MRKLLPLLFSVFLVFVAIAETTHTHEHACDEPCPSVCLGGSSSLFCGNSDPQRYMAPVEISVPVFQAFEVVTVHRLSEDEIFHPPAV